MAIVVQANFNVADQTGLPNAETGQAWQVLSGSFRVTSNKATVATTIGDQFAVINSGISDGRVSAIITQTNVNGWVRLAFRAVDNNNLWFIDHDGSRWRLMKKFSGVYTQVATSTVVGAPNGISVTLAVELSGSSISWYFNGILASTVTDAALQTATRHGIGAEAPMALIDDFIVDDMSPAGGTGTPGSVSYATRQRISQSNSVSLATHQRINQVGSTAFTTKQAINLFGSISVALRQIINQSGSISNATKQIVNQIGFADYRTMQRVWQLSSIFSATRQSWYQSGFVSIPAVQVFTDKQIIGMIRLTGERELYLHHLTGSREITVFLKGEI